MIVLYLMILNCTKSIIKMVIYKSSLFSVQLIEYIDNNRKASPLNGVKSKPTKGKCWKIIYINKGKNRKCQRTNFYILTEQLETNYLDRYKGVQVEKMSNQFDESSKVEMPKDVLKTQLLLTDHSTMLGTLQDSNDYKILLYSGATKCFMSKQYYIRNNLGFPMFTSEAKDIQVENGASVHTFLIMTIITTIYISGYMYEIHNMVSKIHDSIDLVLGAKTLLNQKQK